MTVITQEFYDENLDETFEVTIDYWFQDHREDEPGGLFYDIILIRPRYSGHYADIDEWVGDNITEWVD